MPKLLLDPIYTSIKTSKCSTYFALKETGLSFLEANEENFVYCLVPDEKNELNDFINDDLVEHPRWINIPVFFGRDRYQNMFFPPDDLMQVAIFNKYWDWDFLLTTRNNGFFWKFIALKNDRSRIKKQLILQEPFPMFNFKKTVNFTDIQTFGMLNSYLAFDYIYIQAQWEKDEIIKLAKKFLTPFWCMELMKKIVVTYPKPRIDYEYPYTEKKDFTKPLNLVYVQRLDNFERRVDDLLDVLRKTFILSNDGGINFRISTNSEKEVTDDTRFIAYGRLPRNEFYDMLKGSDVLLSWSIDEGMPFSLLEATAFGVIPLAKREKWSEDFFGKDYFGLVNTKEEAITKILWIKDNREIAHKQFLDWYKNDFHPRIVGRGNQNELFADVVKKSSVYSEEAREKINELLSGSEEAKLSTIINGSQNLEIDFNDLDKLSKLEGVRMSPSRPANVNVPMNRLKDFYIDRLALLRVYGWHDTSQPGLLKRKI